MQQKLLLAIAISAGVLVSLLAVEWHGPGWIAALKGGASFLGVRLVMSMTGMTKG